MTTGDKFCLYPSVPPGQPFNCHPGWPRAGACDRAQPVSPGFKADIRENIFICVSMHTHYLIPCSLKINHFLSSVDSRVSLHWVCWHLRHLQVDISVQVSYLDATSTLRAFLFQSRQSKGQGINNSQMFYNAIGDKWAWLFPWARKVQAPHARREITSKGLQQRQSLQGHRERHPTP